MKIDLNYQVYTVVVGVNSANGVVSARIIELARGRADLTTVLATGARRTCTKIVVAEICASTAVPAWVAQAQAVASLHSVLTVLAFHLL